MSSQPCPSPPTPAPDVVFAGVTAATVVFIPPRRFRMVPITAQRRPRDALSRPGDAAAHSQLLFLALVAWVFRCRAAGEASASSSVPRGASSVGLVVCAGSSAGRPTGVGAPYSVWKGLDHHRSRPGDHVCPGHPRPDDLRADPQALIGNLAHLVDDLTKSRPRHVGREGCSHRRGAVRPYRAPPTLS